MNAIPGPIVLVGTGRSGSTALHRLLARHPQLAWLSVLSKRYPHRPEYNRNLMRALDLPVLGQALRRRFHPSEAYPFWEAYAPGFGRPFRDLAAADVTVREQKKIQSAMAACLTATRSRLLLKITGWPRIAYLAEVFPDARFVHLVRDGRAVANSMLAVDFWDGWHGPGRWRWDLLSDERQAAWEKTGRSFVALAGYEWLMMLEAAEEASRSMPSSQFLEIRYEDFCSSKVETVRQVLDFAGLDWTPDFAREVEGYPARNTNFKWQTDLTPAQQQILEEVQRPYLEKYRYLS